MGSRTKVKQAVGDRRTQHGRKAALWLVLLCVVGSPLGSVAAQDSPVAEPPPTPGIETGPAEAEAESEADRAAEGATEAEARAEAEQAALASAEAEARAGQAAQAEARAEQAAQAEANAAALARSAAPTTPADPPDQSEGAAVRRARRHMERGQNLYLQARFEEAASEFEEAYAARPFSAFLYNAAVALERAGHPARAARFFDRYVATDPRASDADTVRARAASLRRSTETGADTANAEPGQGSPDTPADVTLPSDFKSLLSIRTNPEGATIIVRQGQEEVTRGPAPFNHTLQQGRYTVEVEHPDYQTVSSDVLIEPGKVYVVIVEMSQGEFLGYLRVTSSVVGASVYIDDREQGPRGQTPFEAPIPVGDHQIWVERPGYVDMHTESNIAIGEDVRVHLALNRVDYGRIRVVSNRPGAQVWVDDELQGTVPYEGQVSPGPHRVSVQAGGMKDYNIIVDIERGQLTPIRARLRPSVGRAGGVATSIFAALFVGGGATLAILGNDLMSTLQLEAEAGRLSDDDPRIDQGFFMYLGADVAFGLGAVLGAMAMYYLIYDPLPPSEGAALEPRDWALLPMVQPSDGIGGVQLMGRF